jgi:hypothetical protein
MSSLLSSSVARGDNAKGGERSPSCRGYSQAEQFLKIIYMRATFLDLHSDEYNSFILSGELGGSRTHDPRLKRALLYQLSYELLR